MKSLLASLSIALATSCLAATPAGSETAEASPARAEPSAEHLALARQFFASSTSTDLMMEGVKAGFWSGAAEGMAELDDAELEELGELAEQLFVKLEPKVEALMPSMLDAYAKVYASEFSVSELREMVAFAETPAGKHYLSRQGLLEMDPRLAVAQEQLMLALAPAMQEFAKELCSEKAAKRLAAGDTTAKCPLAAKAETRPS